MCTYMYMEVHSYKSCVVPAMFPNIQYLSIHGINIKIYPIVKFTVLFLLYAHSCICFEYRT